MKKSIILTIDLLLAGIIFVGFLTFLEYYHEEPSFDNKILHSYAKNALIHMDESLKTMDAITINHDISTYFPIDYLSYQLNIKYYDDDNVLVEDMTFGHELSTDYVVVNREFEYSDGFGIASMRAWVGQTGLVLNNIELDLWEINGDEPLPVDFSTGLNSTGNSFGPLGDDDGWDWDTDYYGTGSSTCCFFNNATVSTDQEIKVMIGDYYDGCAGDGEGDAQYGVKFYINETIASSGTITVLFDWVFDDHGLDNGDDGWVKARFGNISGMNYLGTNAGYGNDDPTPEILYDYNPNDHSGSFSQDITSMVSGEGWYYLDMGCKLRDWDNGEWLECGFDNVDVEWS